MPTQAQLDAQNNATRSRQQARRGIEQPAPQVQQPYVNPYGGQYGTGSIQDQGYYDNYYDEEEMTEEEWAAYLAGLQERQESQDVPSYYSDYGSRMPDGPIDAPYSGGPQATTGNVGPQITDASQLREFMSGLNEQAQEAETPYLQYIQDNAQQSQGGGANQMEQGSAGSPQSNYYDFVQRGGQMNDEQLRQANEMASSMGTTFDPETGYSRQPYQDRQEQGPQVQAPMSVRDTQDMLQERFGAPTVSGNMNPSMSGLETDAQGRMIDPNVDRSDFERESAAREARQAARPDFGKVQRDGDTGDGAPTALFKKEAESAGLSGRAKSEFVSERSRAWSESKEDREVAKSSGRAAAGRSATELGIKVSAENRELTEDEKKNGVELSSAAGALNSLKADLDLVREKGEEISTLSQKSLTEGILGKAISKISPTSSAAKLERASGVLTGDAFIKGMQVIKEFGGGLGSVTEVEGLKVERAQGAIFESGMSGEERRAAVNNYIEVRENAYNRIHSQFVKQYGAEEAATYLGDSSGNVGQAGQTGSRYADDQDHGAAVNTYYQG